MKKQYTPEQERAELKTGSTIELVALHDIFTMSRKCLFPNPQDRIDNERQLAIIDRILIERGLEPQDNKLFDTGYIPIKKRSRYA